LNLAGFRNEEGGFFKDRCLRADGFIIRAQATICTDGFSSVQVFERRANRVFCTDEKRIRTENAVLVNTKRNAAALQQRRRDSSHHEWQ
jgi:hypothetical protein